MGDCLRYEKTCRDFSDLGLQCCAVCHEDPDNHLDVVVVDGIPALLCCELRKWFYPDGSDSKLSPEEKLLRAIFGESHGGEDNIDKLVKEWEESDD
jgi:hypothetical protein